MSDNEKIGKEVFISYSTKDGDDAHYLCNLLEGAGVSCWIAPRDIPSGAWAAAIMEGLQNCKVVAFLSSTASLGSKEVAKEIDIANGFRKEILPIRLQNIPLTGEFAYHLSSRQWIDAHEGDRSTRFAATLQAILKLCNKSGAAVVAQGSVLGQARSLVAKLNQQYSEPLGTINAMFSAQERQNFVSVYFPLRIGATGVDLYADFNQIKKTISIYANAATDGDRLKWPFIGFLKNEFNEKRLSLEPLKKDGARRWEFVTLLSEKELEVPWLCESPEACFPRFADYVTALFESVMPSLLDWTVYASEIDNALETVEKRLREVFPETDGWRIGAPEGGRLNGFLATGKINVFKERWAPQWDNYHDRGHLAITLEAGSDFLRGLKIGVLKYDTWFDIGKFGQELLDAGKDLLPNIGPPSGAYALEFNLKEEWRDCGFADAKLHWRGKLDSFVDDVVLAFTQLKHLESILDQACAAIPALQDIDPSQIQDAKKPWGDSALYIRNRLRLITKGVTARCKDTRIVARYRYHYQRPLPNGKLQFPEWTESDLLLMVKVGRFDVAITFEFTAHCLNIRVVSVYFPDFESGIATAFLKARHPNLSFEGIPNQPTICQGLSVVEWMDKVQQCVEARVDAFIPALDDLAIHLEQCKALTEFATSTLSAALPVESGWLVENNAESGGASLEAGNPISIYRKHWLPASNGASALPAIRIELVPNKACFDDLYLSLKLLAQPGPEIDRAFAQVFGACEFAFGPHEQVGNSSRTQVEWAKRLDPSIGLTGGSDFARKPLSDEGKAALASHLQFVAASILKMELMLAGVCQKQMAASTGGNL